MAISQLPHPEASCDAIEIFTLAVERAMMPLAEPRCTCFGEMTRRISPYGDQGERTFAIPTGLLVRWFDRPLRDATPPYPPSTARTSRHPCG